MGIRTGLVVGVFLLLLVDVIWVGSSAISRHLFHDEGYSKPLFWTYFKTTLFSIYLSAFLFWRPWQRMCWEGCRGRSSRTGMGGGGGVMLWLWGRVGGRREVSLDGTNIQQKQVADTNTEEGEENESTSCGVVDVTTGQCTPTDGQPSFIPSSPLGHEYVSKEENEEEEEGITCKDEDITLPNSKQEEKEVEDEKEGEEETESLLFREPQEEEGEIKPCIVERRRGGRGRGRNRHARVVGGRVFFTPESGSINGETCPVNPPLPTCKLDSSCLLGPPEFKPLNCTLSEEDKCQTGPLSPCSSKCCKVRFKRTIEVREMKSDGEKGDKVPLMPVWKVASLALIFGVVWFFANYLYALALVSKSVALVNTLSSMSSVFVMLLAALPLLHRDPRDKITLSRFLVSLLSVGGAALVSISDSTENDHQYWSAGALIALASASLYAVYLVLLKKLVENPASLELPMFFGFVGLFNGVLLLPLVVIWHYTGIERFQWPPTPNDWTLLLVNGFVGTVISELLWLGGVFLTSPLVGTLSLALVTPFSITYSVFLGQAHFSVKFFGGAVIVIICFVLVTILDHFGSWDPLWALIKTTVAAARNYRVHREYDSLSEESKRLIEDDEDSASDQLSFNVT